MSDGKRILIVDENRDETSLITLVLTKELQNIQVLCAGDRDAFERLLQSPAFEVAVTESRVSWASGFEVLRSIRRVAPHCPVLMFTGCGDEELASEAFKQGFDDYLPKSARGYLQLPKRVNHNLDRMSEVACYSGLFARYQTLFELLDQAAFFASTDGILIEANPAFAYLLHLLCLSGASGLKGHPLSELLGSPDIPRFLQTLVPGQPRSITLTFDRTSPPSSVLLKACRLEQGFRLPPVLVGTLERQEEGTPGHRNGPRGGIDAAQEDARPELEHVVSHDLQEPLREISRYARLLFERVGDADAETRRCLDHVTEGAGRMRTMLDRYTECLRVGARGEQFQEVDLGKVMETVCTHLSDSIEKAKATVVHAGLPTVWGKYEDIVRLLENLVENGLKFRRQEPPVVEIRAVRRAGDWVLSVKDNGIGIDQQEFPRIFRMFQRLHTAEERPGLGMGLPICKRIVEAHGGRIWVDSRPGFGSTFHFSLPAVSESHEAEQRDDSNSKATIGPGF